MKKTFLLFLLWAAPIFAQHTYYISKTNGLDTRTSTQAQSKATPWAHLPGMAGCTSNCASYSPVAGDQFILYGGDTWVAADLGINWTWAGTSGSPIYIGVDQTWYTGGSWARPKFDCQNTQCSSNPTGSLVWLSKDWVTFDNVEFVNFRQTTGGINLVGTYGTSDEVEHCYFHGWSATGGLSSNTFALSDNWTGPSGGVGTKFHDNVIDGSDAGANQGIFGGVYHGYYVYNNVIRYVYNGMNGSFKSIYGNLVELNVASVSGDHCNMIKVGGLLGGEPSTLWVYNNIIRNAGCSGGSNLYAISDDSCPSCVSYVFNNVVYGNSLSFDPAITIGGNTYSGTYYYWNNTVQSIGDCFFNGNSGNPTQIAHYQNNHCIQPSGSAICGGTSGIQCINDGGNLKQTDAQADANTTPHFDQYTSSQTYAYSPVASTNSTVGGGNNLTSSCSTVGIALCSDMAYATYNTTNHTVVMRTVNARPGSGAWDAGAYQFSGTTTPVTPTFTPASGASSAPIIVTVSTTSGTVICHGTTNPPVTNGAGTGCTTGTAITTNSGTNCVASSTVCGDFTVTTSQTQYAVAGLNAQSDSSVASAVYTINPPAVAPGATIFAGVAILKGEVIVP